MRHARRSPLLRRLCLLLALCFVWSFALAPCAVAAQAAKKARPAPARPQRFTSLADKLANTPYTTPATVSLVQPAQAASAPGVSETPPAPPAAGAGGRASVSLLNDVGHLDRPVAPALVAAWKAELKTTHPPPSRAAVLHLWLGEYALAHDRQPEEAGRRFRQAQHLTGAADPLHGLAAYDDARALFFAGAYRDAADAFHRLLAPKTRLAGYDVRTCALWWRHAGACAGYHEQRSDMGIPEPSRLDPLCGVAALAASLQALGLPHDRAALLKSCHVTGMGSDLYDLGVGAHTLGAALHCVTADDKGLVSLPKPLIAHVEHDHFVAVIRADSRGVAYLCSDCGPWPGGEVDLTWRQWRALEPDVYGVAVTPGGPWDQVLARLPASPGTALAVVASGAAPGVRVASASLRGLRAAHELALLPRLAGLRGHVFRDVTTGKSTGCDRVYDTLLCMVTVACPMDCGGASGGGPFGFTPLGASAGDPVNLATGAEEYAPPPDLTVYNPHGPAVVWGRRYNSLTVAPYGGVSDFGAGWSTPYDAFIPGGLAQPEQTDGNPAPSGGHTNGVVVGGSAPNHLVLPDWSQLAFTASAPTASTPHVACPLTYNGNAGGIPMLLDWYYDSAHTDYYFVLTFADRTRWTFDGPAGANSNPASPYVVRRITDRNGNSLDLSYGGLSPHGGYPLSAITDHATSTALLTLARDSSGNVTSATDCYGRSVYYTETGEGIYSIEALTQVSQVVPTGTAPPPFRYQYGYGGPSTEYPQLHAITVPSPTGSGTSVATINYGSGEMVSSLVDANGYKHLYNFSSGDANHSQVTVQDAAGNTVYTHKAGYNADMSETSQTDGKGNATYTVNGFDSHDPYRPSSVTDGNGKTTAYTWDGYGNLLTETPPSNSSRTPAATTNTYDYTRFALGELTQTQEGSKAPTTYAYDDQPVPGGYAGSGLCLSVTGPQPGTVGGGGTVTTTYAYDLTTYNGSGAVTHQGLGNLLSVTTPGNNAATAITTAYGYTSDGGYSQPAAIGQPLTVTDNLGKVTHLRYDSRGNMLSTTDALGNETDTTYNIANQPLQTTFPATGQQGGGHSASLSAYLYPDGPMTGVTSYDESGAAIRQTSYSYGPEGETQGVSGSTEPVTYAYDALYRLSALTDGGGHTTHYYYKWQGYLDAMTYPGYAGPAPAYSTAADGYTNVTGADSLRFPSYDLNGNALARVDGNGVTTTYTHSADPQSLLTNIHYAYPGGYAGTRIADVSFVFDAYGRRSGMTDGTGSQSYAYDDLNLTLTHTTIYTGLPSQTISYGYWPDGSRQSMSIPAGSFSYTYDADGRETGLTNPFSESSSWSYLDNGWLHTRTLVGGAVTASAYNARGFVTDLQTLSAGGAARSDYGAQAYDGVGDRTSVTVALLGVGTGTTSYAYDGGVSVKRSHLTQESSTLGQGYTLGFAYDGGTGTGPGNPTAFAGAGHAFNADNQDTANAYDGDGSPTTYGGRAMTFDPEARATAFGTALTTGYTGDGLRAWKQGSGRTYFLYDGDEPVCELSSGGGVTAVNTFGADGLVSRYAGGVSAFYTFDPSGNLAQVLNGGGAVTAEGGYAAFGQPLRSAASPFGFGGQWGGYTDQETGLVLCTHRYYDPANGRWLTRDPIGYDGGVNLYGYCGNDPVDGVDPEGFQELNTPPGQAEAAQCNWDMIHPDEPFPKFPRPIRGGPSRPPIAPRPGGGAPPPGRPVPPTGGGSGGGGSWKGVGWGVITAVAIKAASDAYDWAKKKFQHHPPPKPIQPTPRPPKPVPSPTGPGHP